MFIRQTRTNNTATGESYVTYRLVRSERIGNKVRQITVLPLGRHFPFAQEDWPVLCQRVEQILSAQVPLVEAVFPKHIERAAQRYAAAILVRVPAVVGEAIDGEATIKDYVAIDVDSMNLTQPRSVGVEHLGLYAMAQLRLVEKLTELGINGPMRAAITGNIIARMAKPASELATWHWLREHSALGELIDADFQAMPHMSLYRASDKVLADGTMATHPGVYCLRSNETTWDAEKLWRTYTMLTDLESVFRSLKTELGLRPVYHQIENRVEGHLFITVLAYQCVQVLRTQLAEAGISDSWAVLRETLSVQRRVTASFHQQDGGTLNVRKNTVAEPDLMTIYRTLGVSASPGGTKKMAI